jgi:hypothetical protein
VLDRRVTTRSLRAIEATGKGISLLVQAALGTARTIAIVRQVFRWKTRATRPPFASRLVASQGSDANALAGHLHSRNRIEHKLVGTCSKETVPHGIRRKATNDTLGALGFHGVPSFSSQQVLVKNSHVQEVLIHETEVWYIHDLLTEL